MQFINQRFGDLFRVHLGEIIFVIFYSIFMISYHLFYLLIFFFNFLTLFLKNE